MKDQSPTPRQAEIAAWIAEFFVETCQWPSYRELGKAMSISSPNGVAAQVNALRKKGLIIDTSAGCSRSLVLAGIAEADNPKAFARTFAKSMKRLAQKERTK